jgi:hypothetical protein
LDGKFRWAQGVITTGFIGARQIHADPSGVYVSGYFGGSVDFDGGSGEENRSSGQVDAFAANYSRLDGSLHWVKGIGSPGRATSIASTMTKSGYYIAGLFALTVNFDPYTGSNFLSSVGGTDDLFIAKYPRSFCTEVDKPTLATQTNTAARIGSEDETNISVDQTTLYPNPVVEQLSIDWKGFTDGPIEVTITDTFGKVLVTTTLSPGKLNLDVSHLASGLHLFHARQGVTATSQRFIKK